MKKTLIGALSLLLVGSCTAGMPATANTFKADTKQEVAEKVTKYINTLDDSLEYGALIYCKDVCYSSPLMYGDTSSIPTEEVSRVYVVSDTDYMVGAVHSHPQAKYNSLVLNTLFDHINERPSPSDYHWGLNLATDGKVFQDFTIWIIGPDNVLRDYDIPKP